MLRCLCCPLPERRGPVSQDKTKDESSSPTVCSPRSGPQCPVCGLESRRPNHATSPFMFEARSGFATGGGQEKEAHHAGTGRAMGGRAGGDPLPLQKGRQLVQLWFCTLSLSSTLRAVPAIAAAAPMILSTCAAKNEHKSALHQGPDLESLLSLDGGLLGSCGQARCPPKPKPPGRRSLKRLSESRHGADRKHRMRSSTCSLKHGTMTTEGSFTHELRLSHGNFWPPS